MGKVIQMVKTSDDNSLFILDFDEENEVLTFRTTRMPNYRQNEKVKISEDMVYTNLYHFPIFFLTKFVTANMD